MRYPGYGFVAGNLLQPYVPWVRFYHPLYSYTGKVTDIAKKKLEKKLIICIIFDTL